jgi:RNA processing factor Prp31
MGTIILIVLVSVLVVMISGGLIWYFTEFKSLVKDMGEFLHVISEAIKDKKLTVAEKEELLKLLLDEKTVLNTIKTKFVENAEELGVEIKNLYEELKAKIKGSK